MENGKTDVIRNYKMMLDAIKKTDKWEEQRPIPPELWKELLYSGK